MAHPLELIRFVRHLHDVNSDDCGFLNNVQRNRCKRWMDAVLSPIDSSGDVYHPDEALPPELTKAAE